ncbi:MAG: oxygen-dependent coproporphyrinogen oxidase [Chloroherpetonaceae bacterium]|nr:oxygen-dependent coproporphyrinogen oxidase [Chloroherpetonaceae bacterium]MCS7211226.1 oxygen-dependent coproporphyrinogen oxidase [Chloroherpetonaceae bacterium]MDW8019239.1 oxygen-dependent coproporphyrinogen oxidase [Chloroherpetonaceae bacterium]MDW8467514.1 oxygen-dependent coproporphyrinogen oxidase [Chloroherpetonaceae bacterium]
MKAQVQAYFESLQNHISSSIEAIDGKGKFIEECWQHHSGGGGRTRVMQDGAIFEKGGVNFSAVSGILPEKMAAKMNTTVSPYFATGVSVVLHPYSPMIPTVHCNYRYFEQYDDNGELKTAWFGGGADLTPYYPFLEDIQHFHRVHKAACDKHHPDFYPRFKAWCDEYFFLPHRGETRGVGGIFFDYLKDNLAETFEFVKSCGQAFTEAYLPIVERRRNEPFGEKEKHFQRLRRGRYVEFNLVYDRGTLFGLETRGRTESILMSLPKEAGWEYNYSPPPNSREAELYKCLVPRDWLSLDRL